MNTAKASVTNSAVEGRCAARDPARTAGRPRRSARPTASHETKPGRALAAEDAEQQQRHRRAARKISGSGRRPDRSKRRVQHRRRAHGETARRMPASFDAPRCSLPIELVDRGADRRRGTSRDRCPSTARAAPAAANTAISRGLRSRMPRRSSLGDRAEDDPAIEPEHIGGAQDQAGRRQERHPGVDPEGAEQDQELADEAAGAGQADRGQHEQHEDEGIARHAVGRARHRRSISRVCSGRRPRRRTGRARPRRCRGSASGSSRPARPACSWRRCRSSRSPYGRPTNRRSASSCRSCASATSEV